MSKSNYKRIGDFIRLVDVRNKNLSVDTLLGITVNKVFIPSVANTIGTDMSNYKIIKRNQFACSVMQVRRDKKMPVALLKDFDEAIISQAYPVFEVIDTNELLPEYLMMWFSRSEFDREACFYAVGGVRGSLEWEDFLDMQLPVPSIEKQREIVKEYNIIVDRITLNEKLNQKLEETAQALYKHWFVDFEFPNENGEPYKSSGGKMVWSEELGKEIPVGWGINSLGVLCNIKGGKRLPKGASLISVKNIHPYIKVADMGKNKFVVLGDQFEFLEDGVQEKIKRYIVLEGDIIISIVGTIGVVKVIHKSLDKSNLTENCVKLTDIKKINADYIYHFLISSHGQKEIEMKTVGGVQGKLPMYNIKSLQVVIPSDEIMKIFTKTVKALNNNIQTLLIENINSNRMKDLLLSKTSKVNAMQTKYN